MKFTGWDPMDNPSTLKVKNIRYVNCPCICLYVRIDEYVSCTNYVTATLCIVFYFQMTEQGDLIVRNLSFEDMGNFQCLVKNINGSDMIETFVYPLAQGES